MTGERSAFQWHRGDAPRVHVRIAGTMHGWASTGRHLRSPVSRAATLAWRAILTLLCIASMVSSLLAME